MGLALQFLSSNIDYQQEGVRANVARRIAFRGAKAEQKAMISFQIKGLIACVC